MKEKEIKIKTSDGFFIYGKITESTKKSDSIIIFVHGLLGNQHQHIFHNSIPFFTKNNYATFQFDLYSSAPKTRSFSNTTLKKQAEDITLIKEHLLKKYRKIYIVSHSLGAINTLLSDLGNVSGLIFWDPSIHPSKVFSSAKYNKKIDTYLYDIGSSTILIKKKVINQIKKIPSIEEILDNIKCPVKIIGAENGCGKLAKTLYHTGEENCNFILIKNADHNFSNINKEKELFKETLMFLKNRD